MKTIISDVDGIILDFAKAIVDYINEIDNSNLSVNDIDKFNIGECKGFPDDFYTKYYIPFTKTSKIGQIPYIKDALYFFNSLSENFKLILLTDMDKKLKDKREKNLIDLNYHDILYDNKKLGHILKINPDYIFEDKPEVIFDYDKSSWKGIILVPDIPYTRGFKWKKVVKYTTFNEVIHIINNFK